MISRVLAVAVLGVALCTMSLDAQGTKKAPPPAGSIEIYKNKDGEYRYRVLNAEGKTIAMPPASVSWEKRADVLKAIGDLKALLNSATPVDEKADAAKDKTPEVKVPEKKVKS